jgi:hypothetical protein
VRHGEDAEFRRGLELVMATLRAGLFSSVVLLEPDDFAAAQRVQEVVFGQPASPLDKLLVHDCDLSGRSTEADSAELGPESQSFAVTWRWRGCGFIHE